jgi:hypothetical protein
MNHLRAFVVLICAACGASREPVAAPPRDAANPTHASTPPPSFRAHIDATLEARMRAAGATDRIPIAIWVIVPDVTSSSKPGRVDLERAMIAEHVARAKAVLSVELGVAVTGELDVVPLVFASATRAEIAAIAARVEFARIDFHDNTAIEDAS